MSERSREAQLLSEETDGLLPVSMLGDYSSSSFELTSESENESTTSDADVLHLLWPGEDEIITPVEESLLGEGDVSAGDFMPYQHSTNNSTLDGKPQPSTSGAQSKPVIRFGDILQNMKEKNDPSEKIPLKESSAIAAKNSTKPLNTTKKARSKRPKKAVKHKRQAHKAHKPSKAKLKVKSGPKDASEFVKDERGMYKCPQCPGAFKKIVGVKSHLRVHNKKLYTCDQCNARYTYHHTCKQDDLSHECPTCLKTFTTAANLVQHKKTHKTEREFTCHICDKAFHVKSSIIAHLKTHREKRYKCSGCEKIFSSKPLLRLHSRTHTQEKPYECKFCGKRFSQRSNMNTHQRIHTKAHPYLCDTCNKSFAHKSTYNSHLRTHTKEKPYVCEKCDKRFSHRGSLFNHKSIHDKAKYSCSYCDAKFGHPQSLQYHENNHIKLGHLKKGLL